MGRGYVAEYDKELAWLAVEEQREWERRHLTRPETKRT